MKLKTVFRVLTIVGFLLGSIDLLLKNSIASLCWFLIAALSELFYHLTSPQNKK